MCVAAQIFEMSFLKFLNISNTVVFIHEKNVDLRLKNIILKLRNWIFRKLYDEDGCYNLQICIGIIVYVIFSYCVYLLQNSLFAFLNM